jgi:SAM-dependent methyltransferase
MEEHEIRRYLTANRANWDARATIHRDSAFYDIARYIDDPHAISDTVAWDREQLGELAGLDILHLQCHIGTDSISLARLGANVTGLDFSSESIRIARELSAQARAPVTFVCADVHTADRVLVPQFDVVYATAGVLCWIPDFRTWASAAASCMRPGGRLYIRDGHPVKDTFDYSRSDDLLVCTNDYFAGEPDIDDAGYTYTRDGVQVASPVNYQWIHPLSTVVTALAELGLRIDRLDETDWTGWQAFPWLIRADHGHERWTFPPGHPRLPLAYSITATKPR